MRSRLVAVSLIVVGLGIAIAWCVLLVPVLFMAEAGARPDIAARALVAAPPAVASALLITGGRLGGRSGPGAEPVRGGGVFDGVVLVGMVVGMGALLTLIAAR